MYLEVFYEHFSAIQEQRQTAKITYPLLDILFVTLCAVIAGAEGWKDIQEYGEGHLSWFQKLGFLKDGVPVDDTIARIISKIEPNHFRQCFIDWMSDAHQLSEGNLVAIDGKTLRGSYNREDRRSTLHMLNAYACANKLVIGQYKTDSKSNEITAIPELIKLLDLRGALVSIDAMGCQTEIASAITKKGADYLLAVKGNQPTLQQAIHKAFESKLPELIQKEKLQFEKGHGRAEARSYMVLSSSELEGDFASWKKLSSIGVAMGYTEQKGKAPSLEYRYYISSANLDEKQFKEAVRGHWSIENSLHWVLDATMKEDDCQIYRGNAAENWAITRQISLNMLREEPTKASIPTKRKRAWMKTSFLEKVLVAGFGKVNTK